MIDKATRKAENKFQFRVTKRNFLIAVIGNIILGFGIALLRVSNLGNDPFTAMNMSISDLLPIGLGAYQLLFNCSITIFLLVWGRKYVGVGSLINMFLLGYIVEYTIPVIEMVIGEEGSHSFVVKLIIMIVACLVVSLGIAIYQESHAGVSPYDFLSLGMTDSTKIPYFANRMAIDSFSVVVALSPWLLGMVAFSQCHIGIGTVVTAFCFGPLVDGFSRLVVRKIIKD